MVTGQVYGWCGHELDGDMLCPEQFCMSKDPDHCNNCGGRKCMSCIFREIHDQCEDDCPLCCEVVE